MNNKYKIGDQVRVVKLPAWLVGKATVELGWVGEVVSVPTVHPDAPEATFVNSTYMVHGTELGRPRRELGVAEGDIEPAPEARVMAVI